MGLNLPDPVPIYGDDCIGCTPGLFPPGETPSFIFVLFENIKSCYQSPHTVPETMLCKLYQVPGLPCRYRHNGTVWKADLFIARGGTGDSFLGLFDEFGWVHFVSRGAYCPPEFTIFENEQFLCLYQWASHKGTAIMFFDDTIARLIDSFGLQPGKTLFLESFDGSGGFMIQKFCDLYQRTNIKFKILI